MGGWRRETTCGFRWAAVGVMMRVMANGPMNQGASLELVVRAESGMKYVALEKHYRQSGDKV